MKKIEFERHDRFEKQLKKLIKKYRSLEVEFLEIYFKERDDSDMNYEFAEKYLENKFDD